MTIDIENWLQASQGQGIRLNRLKQLREYFRQFSDMLEPTSRIIQLLSEYLPDARLALEVYQDPEMEDAHLVLYVRFQNYAPNTMEKIRNFRANCREYFSGKSSRLHITTDFRPVE